MRERPQVASFGYHEVTDAPADSGFQRPGAMPYKHTRAAFDDHLAQIATGPVAPTVPVTAVDLARPGRHLMITFDDGGTSNLHAAEALGRRGWVGHFFVVTGRMGTRGFMTPGEVRELRAMGHVVGSHSHTHPNIFREQTMARMLGEWLESGDRLAQVLGEPIPTAAVPGGHISSLVTLSAARAGLRYLFTCEPTVTPWQVEHCWVLGRALVKVSTSSREIHDLAHFRGWGRARAVRLAKDAVRRAVPGLYRAYVARTTREWAPSPLRAPE